MNHKTKNVLACVGLGCFSLLAQHSNAYPIFGRPGYDPVTQTGFATGPTITYQDASPLASDGTVVTHLSYLESNVLQYRTNGIWRANGSLITFPAVDPQFEAESFAIADSRETIGRYRQVGSASNPDFAIRWSPTGESMILDQFGTDESTVARGFDSQGTVLASNSDRYYRWHRDGSVTQLPIPDGYLDRENAYGDINKHGQVVGQLNIDTGQPNSYHFQAIRWEPDDSVTLLDMTTNTGKSIRSAAPDQINSIGGSAGEATTFSNEFLFIHWTPDGQAIELQKHPQYYAYDVDYIYDLNDNGVVVGMQQTTGQGNPARALKWSPDGTLTILEFPPSIPQTASTFALEVNNFGYIVGTTTTFNHIPANGTAALWGPEGNLISIESLIPVDSGWTSFTKATGITNTGWITGLGRYDPPGDEVGPYGTQWTILLPFAGTYGLGDANFDEAINFNDLLIVAQNYGTDANGSVDVGDFNLDGSVDFNDLLVIAQNYGSQPALHSSSNSSFESDWRLAQSMVPEPSVLSIVGMVMLISRRAQRRPFAR